MESKAKRLAAGKPKRQNKTKKENKAKQNKVESYKRKASEFNTRSWQSKESKQRKLIKTLTNA